MPKLVHLTPDEIFAREREAEKLALSWINGNKHMVALKCAADVGLFADVVLCLGAKACGPDFLRCMATYKYEA